MTDGLNRYLVSWSHHQVEYASIYKADTPNGAAEEWVEDHPDEAATRIYVNRMPERADARVFGIRREVTVRPES